MPQLRTEGHMPAIVEIAPYFDYEHLHPDVRPFSQQCFDLAENMLHDLPSSWELYHGLRKLLEAKDCFVRASVTHLDGGEREPDVEWLEQQAAKVADQLQEARKDSIARQSADVEQYFEEDVPEEPEDA